MKIFAFIPFVRTDEHQNIVRTGLQERGHKIKRVKYFPLLPLTLSLFEKWDVLYLDWVHSFYTSPSLHLTRIKGFFGFLDRLLFQLLKGNRKVFWNIHNLTRHDRLHADLEYIQLRALIRVVDYVRFFSDSGKSLALKHFGWRESPKMFVIPQPLYNINYSNGDAMSSRSEAKTSIRLLFFGSVREGKGIEQLLDDLSKIKDTYYTITFAGLHHSESISRNLLKYSKDDSRITVLNQHVSESELSSMLTQCDCIIIPYEHVLNSGVVTWSLTTNLPIIISDIPSFSYISSCGFCVKYSIGDSDSLQDAMKRAADMSPSDVFLSKSTFLSDRRPETIIQQIINVVQADCAKA